MKNQKKKNEKNPKKKKSKKKILNPDGRTPPFRRLTCVVISLYEITWCMEHLSSEITGTTKRGLRPAEMQQDGDRGVSTEQSTMVISWDVRGTTKLQGALLERE